MCASVCMQVCGCMNVCLTPCMYACMGSCICMYRLSRYHPYDICRQISVPTQLHSYNCVHLVDLHLYRYMYSYQYLGLSAFFLSDDMHLHAKAAVTLCRYPRDALRFARPSPADALPSRSGGSAPARYGGCASRRLDAARAPAAAAPRSAPT